VIHDAPVLLVTGASSGIGRAVAEKAAAHGWRLVLVGRDRVALDEVADACRERGAATVTVEAADVGSDPAVGQLVDRVERAHGRLDAVVNVAGVVAYGRVEDVPAEVFDGVIRTNLLGSVNLARHVLPVLRRQGRGHLVLIGSVLGHIAAPHMTAYVVSKWGVRSLARQLQVDNRDVPNVHVSYLAPGGVDTSIYETAANYLGVPGRPPAPVSSPERVADAILRLLARPRPRTQVGVANGLIRFGFSALPGVFDALVGPLFGVAALDRTTPVGPGPGNVLEPAGHAPRGGQGNAVAAVGRNLATLARDRRRA
jgi:short-subunit dehydrogenase